MDKIIEQWAKHERGRAARPGPPGHALLALTNQWHPDGFGGSGRTALPHAVAATATDCPTDSSAGTESGSCRYDF
jgi:hypothetical protein